MSNPSNVQRVIIASSLTLGELHRACDYLLEKGTPESAVVVFQPMRIEAALKDLRWLQYCYPEVDSTQYNFRTAGDFITGGKNLTTMIFVPLGVKLPCGTESVIMHNAVAEAFLREFNTLGTHQQRQEFLKKVAWEMAIEGLDAEDAGNDHEFDFVEQGPASMDGGDMAAWELSREGY
jgi:hypothetical protein